MTRSPSTPPTSRRRCSARPPPKAPLDSPTERLDAAGQALLKAVDFRNGGFRGAPKFPQTAVFEFLWRLYRRTGQQPYRDAVITTLTHLSQGGIYDHLGGGFARYSVDAEWLVPHFEKMLYDNAQLLPSARPRNDRGRIEAVSPARSKRLPISS